MGGGTPGDLTKQKGIGIMIQSAKANAEAAVPCADDAAERRMLDTI